MPPSSRTGYERFEFLSTLPPTRRQGQLALATILISTLIFLIAVPFAKMPLGKVWAFIPAYQAALIVNDLITAVLLFGQYAILRSRSLQALASGYLFTALMASVHALSFPGLFADSGLLSAGPQTTAWLYMFWHGGFPLLVVAYVLLANRSESISPSGHAGGSILASIAATVLAVCAFTLIATVGQQYLPPIMRGNHYTPLMIGVVSSVWGLSLLALFSVAKRRTRTVLDLWLAVVLFAWLCDIALAAVLNGGRFDLGFYAGRLYGLLAASFVLLVLLLENGMLYARLVDTATELDSAKQTAEEATRGRSPSWLGPRRCPLPPSPTGILQRLAGHHGPLSSGGRRR